MYESLYESNYKDVIDFIKHFKGAEDVFLYGCCYWFASILQDRFNDRGYLADIFYEPIDGHFITRLISENNNEIRFFDIRGDVTDKYDEEELENIWLTSMNDEKRYVKLMCDCRDFIDPEYYPTWLKMRSID